MTCIILIGNLASGKSTIAKALGMPTIAIDNYREHTDNEYQARAAMLQQLHFYARQRQSIVYETTGANQVHIKMLKNLKLFGYTELRVLLQVSETESRRRCTARGTAAPFGKTHGESYLYIQNRLKNEWGDLFFDTEKATLDEVVEGIRFRVKG